MEFSLYQFVCIHLAFHLGHLIFPILLFWLFLHMDKISPRASSSPALIPSLSTFPVCKILQFLNHPQDPLLRSPKYVQVGPWNWTQYLEQRLPLTWWQYFSSRPSRFSPLQAHLASRQSISYLLGCSSSSLPSCFTPAYAGLWCYSSPFAGLPISFWTWDCCWPLSSVSRSLPSTCFPG